MTNRKGQGWDLIAHTADLAEFRGGVIEGTVNFVADQMREIHGGDWSTIIDHEKRAVMIFQNTGPSVTQRKRGEAV